MKQYSMRAILLVLGYFLSALSSFAETQSAAVRPELNCESKAPEFGDKRDFTCSFIASGAEQRLRFKANFTGSHDDTKMSMTAILDGQELVCGEGSKMSSQFEDGEVSLECRFAIHDKPGMRHVLNMALVWTHAQYLDFEFVEE